MPFTNFTPSFVRRFPGATFLTTITLAAGVVFGIVAANNSNSAIREDKTRDGRIVFRQTSSGATTQSGRLVVFMPTLSSTETDTSPFPYIDNDIMRLSRSTPEEFVSATITQLSSSNATADWLAQNSNGTDFANFSDFGHTSATYNVLGGSPQAVGPNEGYVFNAGSGMSIGSERRNSPIKFWVTDTNISSLQIPIPASAERMRLTRSGAEIGTLAPSSRLFLSGALIISKGGAIIKASTKFGVGLEVKGAISGATMNVGGVLPGQALCAKAAGQIGYCSTTPTNGTCTCQ